MYGLSEDVDLSFFIGRRLEQVCLGEYQVQLRFDADTVVSIDDSEYTYRGMRRSSRDGRELVELVGRSCTAAAREGEGDLRLDFAHEVLVIHDSNAPHYESYTIRHGDDPVVVV